MVESSLVRVLADGSVRIDAVLSPTLSMRLSDLCTTVAEAKGRLPSAFFVSIWPRLTESLREIFSRGFVHGAISPETILINSFGGASLLQVPARASSSASASDDVYALGAALLAAISGSTVSPSVISAINSLLDVPDRMLSLIMSRRLSVPSAADDAQSYCPEIAASDPSASNLAVIDVDAVSAALGTMHTPIPTSASSVSAGEARRNLSRTPPSTMHTMEAMQSPPVRPSTAVASVLDHSSSLSNAEEIRRKRLARNAAVAVRSVSGTDAGISISPSDAAKPETPEEAAAAARKEAYETRIALKARYGGGASLTVNRDIGAISSPAIAVVLSSSQSSRSRGLQRTPPQNASVTTPPPPISGVGSRTPRGLTTAEIIAPMIAESASFVSDLPLNVSSALAMRAARLASKAAEEEEILRVARIAAHAERSALAARAAEIHAASADMPTGLHGARPNSIVRAPAPPPSPPPAGARALPQTPSSLRAAKEAAQQAEEAALTAARIAAFKERQTLRERFGR